MGFLHKPFKQFSITPSLQHPIPQTGADGRDRTDDLRFTKPLLYQLSYIGFKLLHKHL